MSPPRAPRRPPACTSSATPGRADVAARRRCAAASTCCSCATRRSTTTAWCAAARARSARRRRAGALFILNDRPDLVAACGADGVHVGQDDATPARGARGWSGRSGSSGRSTHAPEQADAAEADPDVDYLAVGPVHATPTKPGRPAAGLGLRRATPPRTVREAVVRDRRARRRERRRGGRARRAPDRRRARDHRGRRSRGGGARRCGPRWRHRLARRARKRREGAAAEPAAAAGGDDHRAGAAPMARGYARARASATRRRGEALVPLAPGERPWPIAVVGDRSPPCSRSRTSSSRSPAGRSTASARCAGGLVFVGADAGRRRRHVAPALLGGARLRGRCSASRSSGALLSLLRAGDAGRSCWRWP